MPDIDLDFPRDIREQLIPRDPRPLRPRALGARLGLRLLSLARRRPRPRQGARAAARRDRAGRGSRRRLLARRRRSSATSPRCWRDGASIDAALALALARLAREAWGSAAPPLPAPGRDGALDPPADRHLPGAAGGDGGTPDRPVGQGLVRGRGLLEDRPARARDAVRGRALRRVDRRGARRAHRPLADRARRRAHLRGDPGGGDDRRVPDREPGADADAAPQPARDARRRRSSRWRWSAPARSRAAPCTPTSSGGGCCARTPTTQVPYEHPSLEPILADTLGAIVFQDQVIQVAMAMAGFTAGEAEGLRRAMSRSARRRR